MAKNKLLATEPAGDAALLNGQPVKEKHEIIFVLRCRSVR